MPSRVSPTSNSGTEWLRVARSQLRVAAPVTLSGLARQPAMLCESGTRRPETDTRDGRESESTLFVDFGLFLHDEGVVRRERGDGADGDPERQERRRDHA